MADIVINPSVGKIDFFTNRGDQNPANTARLTGNTILFTGPLSASSISTGGGGAFVTSVQPTANYLSKFTGNSTIANSLIYDNGTNIGIGTSTVLSKLQVNTATAGSTVVRADGTNGTLFSVVDDLSDSLMSVNNSAGLPVLEVFADDRVVAGQYNTNDFVIVNNKVGIGTNNPVGKLHVTGSSTTPAATFIGNVGIGTTSFTYSNANRGDIEVYGSTDALISLRNATANSYLQKTGNDFYFNNGGAGNIIFQNNSSERIRIDSNGNIGIGTSSPAARLNIVDNNQSPSTGNLLVQSTGGNASIRIDSNSTSNYTYFTLSQGGTGKFELGIVPTTSDFYINSNVQTGATNASIYIKKADGNVGIGTTSPSGVLQVVGTGAGAVGTINIKGSQAHLGLTNAAGTFKGWYGYFNSADHGSDLDLNIKTGYNSIKSNIRLSAIGDTTQVFISGSGYVGIGTTTPNKQLTFTQVDDDPIQIRRRTVSQGGPSSGTGISWTWTSATTDNETWAAIRAIFPGNGDSHLTFSNRPPSGTTTERMRIQNDGNVGIGTSSPNTLLNVHGINPFVRINNSSNGDQGIKISYNNADNAGLHLIYNPNDAISYIDNTYQIISGQAYGDIRFRQNVAGTMTTRMTIKADGGSIGIGTTSPLAKLHMVGSSGGTDYVYQQWSYTNNVGVYDLILKQTVTSGVVRYNFSMNNASSVYNDVLVLDRGCVGIGTAFPGYKLDVNGTFNASGTSTLAAVSVTGTITTSATEAMRINNNNGYISFYNSAGSTRYGYLQGLASGAVVLAAESGAILQFIVNGSERTRIDTSGNVGIGTTSPVAKLDVNGTSNFAANVYHSVGGQKFFAGSGGAYNYIYTGTTSLNFINGNDTSTLMTLLNNGSVGIGLTNPSYKLQVNGDIYASGPMYSPYLSTIAGTYNDLNAPDIALNSMYKGDAHNYDIFQFNAPNTYETQATSGGAWTSAAVNQDIFLGDTTGPSTLTIPNGTFAVRFTWNSIGYRFFNCLYIMNSTQGNYYTVTIEHSANGTTWTTVGTTGGFSGWPGHSRYINYWNNSTTQTYLRLTLTPTWQNANNIFIYIMRYFCSYYLNGAIRLYTWDYSRNISFPSQLYAAGSVGIGTTSPTHKLDIRGDVVVKGGATQHSVIRFRRSDSTTDFGYIGFENPALANDTFLISSAGNGNPLKLKAGASDEITFFGDTTEYGRFNTTGNFGVGLVTPLHKIQASGLVSASDPTYNNDSTFIGAILNNDGTNPGLDLRRWNGGGAGTNNHGATYIATNSVGDTIFYNGLIAANTRATNEKMRIAVNGNVGIGTSSPSTLLHIYKTGLSDASTNALLTIDGKFTTGGVDSNDIVGIAFRVENSGGGSQTTTCIGSSYQSSANSLLLQPVSGNVGIGNINPSYKLDVGAMGSNVISVRLTPGYERVRYYGFDLLGYNDGNLWMIGNNATNGLILGSNWDWDSQIAIAYTPGTYGAGGGSLEIGQMTKNNANFTHGNTRFYTNGVERLRINSSGNVGIGTSSPSYKLHIVQSTPTSVTTAPVNTSIQVDSNSHNYLSFVNTADNQTYAGITFIDNNLGGYIVFRNYTGDVLNGSDCLIYGTYQDHIFQTGTTGTVNSRNEVVRIKNNGNVGIGSTSPNDKLDVVGRVYAYRYIAVSSNASLPAYATDTSTGMFNAATNQIGFTINGTEKLRINSDGNLGIGTSNPTSKLHIVTTGTNDGIILDGTSNPIFVHRTSGSDRTYLATTTNAGAFFTDAGQYDFIIRSQANNILLGRGSGTSTMAIVGSNVGIGTTTPSAKLHLYSSTSGATLVRTDGTNGVLFSVVDDLTDSLMSVNNSAGLPVFEVFADDRVIAGQYNANDLVVVNNKVGIGTSIPVAKLHVTGSTSLPAAAFLGDVGVGTTSPTSQANYRFLQVNGPTSAVIETTVAGSRIGGFDSTSNTLYVGTIGSYPVVFRTAVNEKMRIAADGNVGIGTTSPSWLLTAYATSAPQFVLQNATRSFILTNNSGDNLLSFYYNSANRLQFNLTDQWFNSGNVGIGSTSPGAKLDVAGSIKVSAKLIQNSTTVSVSGTGQTLTLNLDTAAVYVVSMASGATITTISYTNRDNNPSVNTIMLVVKYAGTASITFTNVIWANGVAPTLTGTNGYADVFMLTSYQGGAGTPVWIGTVVAQALVSTNL